MALKKEKPWQFKLQKHKQNKQQLQSGEPVRCIRERIQNLKRSLKDLLEPNFGLLDHLFSLNVINRSEVAEIRSKQPVSRSNACLLEFLSSKSEECCQNFLIALERTSQTHLVNYIRSNGVLDADDDNRPLDKMQVAKINVSLTQLIDLIDPNYGLLAELMNCKCLSWRHREHIEVRTVASERNEHLLDILQRRSVADFKNFIECMVKLEQHFAVKSLKNGGVIVSMVVVLGQDECTPNDEARLVSNFTTLIREYPMERSEQTLHELFQRCNVLQRQEVVLANIDAAPQMPLAIGDDAELIGLKNRNGLTAYFFCRTYAALRRVRDQQLSGLLAAFVEKVFSLLLDGRRIAVRRVEWDATNFDKCVKYFKTIQENTYKNLYTDDSFVRVCYINKLASYLLDNIIRKSAIKLFVQLGKSSLHADVESLHTLARVCHSWHESWNRQKSEYKISAVFNRICRPYARHPRQVSVVTLDEEKKKFYHVAQCGRTVYAIRHKSQALRIFEDGPHQRPQASVLRLGDIQATSLVASDTGDVYVTARSDNWIWRVASAFPSVSAAAERWVTTKRAPRANYPLSLSLSAGRLLVTKRDELMVLDLNGNRSCLVVVQARVRMRHAVETSRGTFVACIAEQLVSGAGGSGRSAGLVAEIDRGGRILKSVSVDGGRQSPLHLDIDCDGRCFVIDSRGSSVLLLNDAFDVERVVLKCDGSERCNLARLRYVAHTDQLLVAVKGGHLHRYCVRQQVSAA